MSGLVKSVSLGLGLALIAGTASAESWVYAGRSPDWALAVDADSVERSGSTVTIRELYVARPRADMPRPQHDYLIAKVVVDCEARTLYKHSYEYFVFGRSRPVDRARERSDTDEVRDYHDQRLWRAACTDFLRDEETEAMPAEGWARILILRLRAADNWQEPLMKQGWRVSRPNNYSCEIRTAYGDGTVLSVTLGIDGKQTLFVRAPEYDAQPSAMQTTGAIGVRNAGGDWREVFNGPVNFSVGFVRGVAATAPGLLDALENAQDLILTAEGLPHQSLQVGPMDEAVTSLRACTLGSNS